MTGARSAITAPEEHVNSKRIGALLTACWAIGGLLALGLTIRVAREPGSSCGANGRTDCGTGFVVMNVVAVALLVAGGVVVARVARLAAARGGAPTPSRSSGSAAAVMAVLGLGGLWYVERSYDDPNGRCGIRSTTRCSPARVGFVGGMSLMLLLLAAGVLVATIVGRGDDPARRPDHHG